MDLTKEILIKNGFREVEDKFLSELSREYREDFFRLEINVEGKFFLSISTGLSNYIGRDFFLHVDNELHETIGSADIQTIEQFNGMMEVLGINFKIK